VVAGYAREVALRAQGVAGIARRGVRVVPQGERLDLEVHLICELGAALLAVCGQVAGAVRAYVAEMTGVSIGTVSVHVDGVAPPGP
jgi:uncharacterized alkaline shock family protein YloU